MLQTTDSDFQNSLKQTKDNSVNAMEAENVSDPKQCNHSVVDLLHLRAHGKVCAMVVHNKHQMQ